MSELFKYYPRSDYNEVFLINIMVRANIIQEILNKFETYNSYTVKEGERPDSVAYDYYGSSDFYWVVLMSNMITDPYYQWPLNETQMRKLLIKKYGSIPQSQTQIIHYEYTGIGGDDAIEISSKDWTISTESWQYMTSLEKSGWSPVYAYEYEDKRNEDKRNIKLLNNQYLTQLVDEISDIFVDG